MNKYIALAGALIICSCGLNLNHESNHPAVRAAAPDKFAATIRLDDEYETQGYSLGLSWNIE